ncbi:hypothetical protein FF011L_42070 [Roseimaritima multifibrata]|uniref:DUF1598 domain-containing protein n=1 Tax=Roseimaritima multifibrata TaxID=1930274 RepID=A0A517MKJ8_9BACT|nr:DUF1598 domain-containing protein [Roseimaritima multifibrata]QDS95411.1 hypothetical protein FF011L_42070 [Roseimaritima multifibrata]
MKPQTNRSGFRHLFSARNVLVAVATLGFSTLLYGGGNNRQSAVGGVSIDASGLVRAAAPGEQADFLNQLRAEVRKPEGALVEACDLRMVSLAKLQAAIRESKQKGERLPDDIRYLAGLLRVEYVFVYPDQQDIVIAGPAEPWIVRDDATVVGAQSGQPTLHLEDLMTAMESVELARTAGISCSIEPTAEGRQRLNALMRRIRSRPQPDPRQFEPAMRAAFGPQTVKLTGIPGDSRYARVLVAADFEMKRLAMDLVESPIPNFPSYMQMARNQNQSASSNPRWWMTTDYDALERTEDRLAWRISGQGVKTMTEIDRLKEDGQVEQTGRVDKTAQKWADRMTEKFGELASRKAVFGDLRNLMDLSVVATLITQERLAEISGCSLDGLNGTEPVVERATFQVPKAIEPQSSFVRGTKGWVVSTSGGVSVNAFEIVESQKIAANLEQVHQKSSRKASESWWWN